MSTPIETGIDGYTPDNILPGQPPAQPAQSVREWAQANGYDVKETGRLPKAVHDAYSEANRA